MADSKLTALTTLSVPDLADLLYAVDVSDTTDDAAGSSRSLLLGRILGLLPLCQGRLTTESGVAVSTSDRTSQSTLYFTPYLGNDIALYDGTRWRAYSFTERSLALSGLTSGLNYDVFIYDNAGTLTLELTAWTNDTTRATALTAQDGILVRSGATTRRYLGTIRTTSTTATEDSKTKRFVWNMYNRIQLPLQRAYASGVSWSYNSATVRQANASSTHQVEFVCGDVAHCQAHLMCNLEQGGTNTGLAGIGYDVTNAFSADQQGIGPDATGARFQVSSNFRKQCAAGYHYLAMCEASSGAGATFNFYGDRNFGKPGLVGMVMG